MAYSQAPEIVYLASQQATAGLARARQISDTVLNRSIDQIRLLGYGSVIGGGNIQLQMNVPVAPVMQPPSAPNVGTIQPLQLGNVPPPTAGTAPVAEPSKATKGVKPTGLDVRISPFVPTARPGGMPALKEFATPDQPIINIPAYPDLTEVRISAFNELAPEYDPSIGNVDFTVVVPDIVPYVEPDSGIVAAVRLRRDWLLTRVSEGGTGLPASVENAIWERERDRESNLMLAAEQEAMTQDAAMGFFIPGGALQAKVAKVRMDYGSKMISIGRESAIKQAQLEIDNINKSLELLSQMESKLIDDDIERKRTTLEACKFATQGAIQIYDARVKGYMAMLDAKKIAAQVYQAVMDGYKARVDAYRAIIDGEKAKADVNQSVVAAFEAQVNVEKSRVDMFRSNVDALVSMTKLEEFKIRKYEAEIGAFVAEVNAYGAEIGGKKAEAEVYGEKIRAYQAEVAAYTAEVQAENLTFTSKIENYKQQVQADVLRLEGYKAQASAEGIRVQATGHYLTALADATRVHASAVGASNSVLSSQWAAAAQAEISAQTLATNVQKMNNDSVHQAIAANNARSSSMAQVYAQLAGSAMNMASSHVNLTADGRASISENWSGQIKSE